MKRIIALLAAVLILVCSLAACGSDSSSDGGSQEPTQKVKRHTEFVGTMKDVDLGALMDKINAEFDLGEYAAKNDSERYYGITPGDVNQFYAQKPVNDREFNEIVICEVATADALDRIEHKLNDQLTRACNSAKSYSKEDLAVVESCKVILDGKYMYLVISPQAEAICELIKSEIN